MAAPVLPGKARPPISNGAGLPRQRWRAARGMGGDGRCGRWPWPGQPAGATARTIVALAGLPASAVLAVVVVAVLAALQVLAGAWLGRAATPHRAAP